MVICMNEDIRRRTKWFSEERFGMFIHWGLYAIPAAGEWIMSERRTTVEEYEKYFREFDPVDFDPAEWAKLAKEAGMRYVVMTAKHHDGFCLFDSQLTDYKAPNTKAGRDLVREYLDAFRAEGLKVGLYYSLLDWHHPDYPKFGDMHHPMRDREEFREEDCHFDSYLDYMHGQVKELVTGYGKLDILWFDFSYGDMCGEKWRASELIKMVRKYQPDVIIDNRLEGSGEKNGSIATVNPLIYSGDFASPEQIIPPQGILDEAGEPIPWELCATMNNHWGYCSFDHTFKEPDTILRKLVECVSKGGNMLMNVGPDARGRIPEESCRILRETGAWLHKNGESIYGCGVSEFPKPEWGRYTQKGDKVYAHIYEAPLGALPLYGIEPEKIGHMRLLRDGSEVLRGEAWNTVLFPEVAFAAMGDNPVFTYPLADSADTVIEITLKPGFKELCGLLNFPEEVCKELLSFDLSFDYSTVRGEIQEMCQEKTREHGLAMLTDKLEKDPHGYKLLACQLKCMLEQYERFQDTGMGKRVFLDTCGCFRRFTEEYKKSYGSYAFDRGWWTVRQTSFTLFRIGALEYELDSGKKVYIHIPSDASLAPSACKESLDQARTFMARYFPGMEQAPWECHSWLLSPALLKILDGSSNIVRFQQLFEVKEWHEDNTEFMNWIFNKPAIPLDELPEKTSLQRAVKQNLLAGGKIGEGIGLLKPVTPPSSCGQQSRQ